MSNDEAKDNVTTRYRKLDGTMVVATTCAACAGKGCGDCAQQGFTTDTAVPASKQEVLL